jgi:hypothetical protein
MTARQQVFWAVSSVAVGFTLTVFASLGLLLS